MSPRRYLGLVRALLVAAGVLLFALGIDTVVTTPPPPPDSDRFLEGLTFFVSLVVAALGLLVAQVGYAVPAGSGRLRAGPLADRSAGLRGGVAALLYVAAGLLLVYVVPAVLPAVTESTPYVVSLLALFVAGVLGAVLSVLYALGGRLLRTARQHSEDDGRAT